MLNKKTTINDVTTDNPVLNVKYLNTLRKEKLSTSEVNKLNNIIISLDYSI